MVKNVTEREENYWRTGENALPSPSYISKADNIVIDEFFLTKKFSGYCEEKPKVERSC